MADLDQGGTAFQKVNVYLGPSLGWFAAQVEAPPQRRITAGGTTVIGSGESNILVDAGANNVTLLLPDVNLWLALSTFSPVSVAPLVPYIQGFQRAIFIKDFGGNAAANNITVTPFGAQTIDKLAQSFTIIQNRQLLRLYPVVAGATGWFSG